jgi:hypothetical protein
MEEEFKVIKKGEEGGGREKKDKKGKTITNIVLLALK